MNIQTWFLLFIACCAMSFCPGPNAVLALTTSVRNGTKSGIAVVIGSLLEFSLLITIAVLGVANFIFDFPIGIFILSLLGAIYLFKTSLDLFRNSTHFIEQPGNTTDLCFNTHMRKGFSLAISNPKIILFWIAFVPAVFPVNTLYLSTILLIVITFIVIEGCAECTFILIGKCARNFLSNHIKVVEKISAVILTMFAILILNNAFKLPSITMI